MYKYVYEMGINMHRVKLIVMSQHMRYRCTYGMVWVTKKCSFFVNNDRATEILRSVSVPVPFYIFPCLFLLRGQNYFTHVER